MKQCKLVVSPHCHCWARALNDLSITLCLGPFPSSLELQQMVEVCSRAPAIGECVCYGLVLQCVAIESMVIIMMMHGQWPNVWDTPAVVHSLM